jgi:Plasmid pRiA4b ORF-3-like protein
MTRLPVATLVLDLRLIGIDPPIWRRVQVPASFSLAELHQVIQAAMQWHDKHLYEFTLADRVFQAPGPESAGEATTEVRLVDLSLAPGAGLRYVYDFGDEWTVAVVVWDRLFGAAGPASCVGGARAAPPEDAGGAHRYGELVEMLRDPSAYPDAAEQLEWLPTGFDAEAFDQAETTIALRAVTGRAI